jgi:hypothetical protein
MDAMRYWCTQYKKSKLPDLSRFTIYDW